MVIHKSPIVVEHQQTTPTPTVERLQEGFIRDARWPMADGRYAIVDSQTRRPKKCNDFPRQDRRLTGGTNRTKGLTKHDKEAQGEVRATQLLQLVVFLVRPPATRTCYPKSIDCLETD